MNVCIYRFQRDLRLEDHAGLAAASSEGEVLPVIVIDDKLRARLSPSPRRAAWYCCAVAALDGALRASGSRLIVRSGEPAAILRALARECAAVGVTWSAQYGTGNDEAATQSVLEEAGLRATVVHDASAVPPEETSENRRGHGAAYRSFVPYFENWRRQQVHSFELPLLLRFARSDVRSDPLPEPKDFGAAETVVDATPARARERLAGFLENAGLQYAFGANVPAEDNTSHLSTDLSFGTIAARSVVRAVNERLQDPFLLAEERTSLRLFLRSIAMRDFFLQLGFAYPRAQSEPLQERMRGFRFANSHESLDAWRSGTTGFPLVDAGVRQLRATGWMHPHVRAVAASFLCFDLGVDWRVGVAEWDRHLVEDDAALAAGNWQWIAGVGADMAQYPRIYNPEKQLQRFDPAGAYVRRWIPELANAPQSALRSRTAVAQLALPLHREPAYPAPVVDHSQAARDFLKRYRDFTMTVSPP